MKTAFQLLACLLAVESAVALSVPARRAPIEIPDNGDGLYVVEVDENNTPIGVEFTALADVKIIEPAVERADITPVPHALLDKRAGVSCSGGVGNTDIDSAQGCLASAAGSGVQWAYHAWVYVSRLPY